MKCPYATITVTYRADVFPPKEIYDAFYFTSDYGDFFMRTSKGALRAGEDLYDSPHTVWAEFVVRRDCEDFIGCWHNKILQWQEQLRNEANE